MEKRPPSGNGIWAHRRQFALLVAINGLVGALIGQERFLIPLLANREFGIDSTVTIAAFLVTFGAAKAPSNLLAGVLAERIGRKKVLVAGWLIGLPAPLLLMQASSWRWVIVANVFLGVNQGLTWSATVLMKIDLAGDGQRGRAVGLNEFSGYVAVGVSALVSGLLADRYGVSFEPFLLGLAIVIAGLLASVLLVRETSRPRKPVPPFLFRLRELMTNKPLVVCARTGLMNNANDAFAWALLPLLLAQAGLSTAEIAGVAATYPIVWGSLQLATGPLSDRIGRRAPMSAGMLLQAGGVVWFTLAKGFGQSVTAAALLGVGTALAYPALIAAAADSAPEDGRASAVGFFRMWRDAGYALGAVSFGAIADVWSLSVAAVVVACLTGASGIDALLHLNSKFSSERLTTPTMPV